MKRKTPLFVFFALLFLALASSCSQVSTKRKIVLTIPTHPWEKITGKRMWYTLKWTDGEELKTIHINQEQRSISVEVETGKTVLAVAYPLGDMSPFGAALTPDESKTEIVLTQEEGYLVSLLSDLDPDMVGELNYGLILNSILEKTKDVRKIDDVSLLRDIQNGDLTELSLKICEAYTVGPFALSNGIWESEFLRDPCIVVQESMAEQINLPAGVFRYLNNEDNMVLVLIVDREGNFYSYLKTSML
jgi:hypothetical protein